MRRLAQVGDFCPNSSCSNHDQCAEEGSPGIIIKHGKTRSGRQRFRCKVCGSSFTATKGTRFFRMRSSEETILDALSQIAEGSRISSASRTKGVKTDTILSWVREAGEHAEEVEEFLLGKHQVRRAQIDGLWAYVQNKGSKKTIEKPKQAAPSGARP